MTIAALQEQQCGQDTGKAAVAVLERVNGQKMELPANTPTNIPVNTLSEFRESIHNSRQSSLSSYSVYRAMPPPIRVEHFLPI